MRRVLPLLAVLSLAFAPAPLPRSKAQGHATPQACFRAYLAAKQVGDWRAYVACLTDDAVAVRNAYFLYLAAHVAEETTEVMRKHGVSRQQLDDALESWPQARRRLDASVRGAADWEAYDRAARRLCVAIEDQRGFAADVMAALFANLRRDDVRYEVTREQRAGRYARLTVEFVSGPNRVVWAVRCVKISGGWKMMGLSLAASISPPLPDE